MNYQYFNYFYIWTNEFTFNSFLWSKKFNSISPGITHIQNISLETLIVFQKQRKVIKNLNYYIDENIVLAQN